MQLKNTQRLSNFELLRIVSMLYVMVVHASFLALEPPTKEFMLASPDSAFMRCLSESISIVCVNCFVLISGWFGIKMKLQRLMELFFQIAFFVLLIPIILYAFNITLSDNMAHYFKSVFFCDEFWFIHAYILLMLFSPLLNAFVEHSDKSQLKHFLLLFFIVQTLVSHKLECFSRGYSPMSFMGLYLLARYMRLYPSRIVSLSKSADLLIYTGLVILQTVFAMLVINDHFVDLATLYAYSSPLVIACSVFFFLYFSKLSFSSRLVNGVAISAFSIYLFHSNPLFLRPVYAAYISEWYSLETWRFLFYVSGFILLIAVSSVLLDKLRLFLWNVLIGIIKR